MCVDIGNVQCHTDFAALQRYLGSHGSGAQTKAEHAGELVYVGLRTQLGNTSGKGVKNRRNRTQHTHLKL